MVRPDGIQSDEPIRGARAVRSSLPFPLGPQYAENLKPIVASICAKTRARRRPFSLRAVARCPVLTLKCRAKNGRVVAPPPSGMTGAWAIIPPLFGLGRGAATQVRGTHFPAPLYSFG